MQTQVPKMRNVVHFVITVIILTLIITIISLLMLKYAVEGENNMPFEISELVLVSTAEGLDIEGKEHTWNFDLVQNNDMYLYISKNKNYKETEIIKNITIKNFKTESRPAVGNIVIYRPSKAEEKIYEYNEEYIIKDEIIYAGSENTNAKNLEISNQGGMIQLRFCNNDCGKYSSDDETVTHDGTILSKINLENKDIACKISFDLSIELESGTKFTGNIKIDLPSRKCNK